MSGVHEFERRYVTPRRGKTLVVGSKLNGPHRDYRRDFEDALGVDLEGGKGVDLVHNMEFPLPVEVGKFHHVVCHSVLEHVQRPWKVAETIQGVMHSEATIYVSVPWIWRFHSYPDDYWRLSHAALEVIFDGIKWKDYAYDLNGQVYVNKPRNKGGTVDGAKLLHRTMIHAFGVLR